MRCLCNSRLVALATALGVAILATGAMAASYSGNVKYDGTSLYFRIDEGKNGTCVEATSNGDGTFAYSFTAANPAKASMKFFKNRTCGNEASKSYNVSDLLGPTDAETNLSIAPNKNLTTLREPANPEIKSSSSSAKSSSSSVKSSSSAKSSSSIKQDPAKDPSTTPKDGEKLILFLTPWTNTSAIVYVNGDSTKVMTKVSKYCGWFQAIVKKPAEEFRVTFRQTIGKTFYGMQGMQAGAVSAEYEIPLDSIANEGDTIWVRSYKADAPSLSTKYPSALGDCPTKILPVMMFDWYDGSNSKGRNGYEARNTVFHGEGTNEDFGADGCGLTKGMVEKELGDNGLPVRAKNFPTSCTNAKHLNNWFIPEVIGKDSKGKTYTNATCRDVTLELDNEGFWLAQKDDSSPEGGMFLLDDFRWLDENNTVENIHYDSLSGNKGYHNFGFTMKIQAKFEYVPGQYFEFYGDDDVWVFINNKLVVDIGGQHTKEAGSVKLDTLGLTEGETYSFHIFYAERKQTQSNFKMRTSMDLQSDASMFLKNFREGKLNNYDIWQINKKDALSCDFSDDAKTTTDTTQGHSTFRLTGGNLTEPEELGIGTYYEGIIIKNDYSFAIDSSAIVDNYALAPGHYFLEISLKSDPSQMTTVEITIPSYAIPTVAFASSDWKLLGKEVSGDTVQIGTWSYEIYPVNITFLEEWAQVSVYNRKISITISDPNIDILDKEGNLINKVTLDSNAQATFYVRANHAVNNATLLVQGAAASGSFWKNLVFKEPPIPRVTLAEFLDRNGDGRGDSLYVKFDRDLDDQHILDTLQFTFGETFAPIAAKDIKILDSRDEIVVVTKNCAPDSACGFSEHPFTGETGHIYIGKLNTWFTYIDERKKTYNFKITNDTIQDGIGPILVKAVKEKMDDGNRQLTLTFSEEIDKSTRDSYTKMFEYICYRSGELATPEEPVQQNGSGNTMTLVFGSSTEKAVYPDDGDQIRFVPGKPGAANVAKDLMGIMPHQNNPWVTIKGDQEISNDSPGLITVSADNPIVANPQTTQPILITDPKLDAQTIGEQLGVQGSLIDFDISKILTEKTMNDIEVLDAFIAKQIGNVKDDTVYNVTEKSKEQALQEVFVDIAADLLGEAYGVSDEVVAGVKDKSITASNYKTTIKDAAVIDAIDKLVVKNVEESRDTTRTIIPASVVSYNDIFDKIVNKEISYDKLREAGVSEDIIDAIDKKILTKDNVENFRSGSETLISSDAVRMSFRTRYYSHLGGYVGGDHGEISCSDSTVYEGNCLEHSNSKIFLAWNMRASDGRLAATGVYIARLELKIYVNDETILDQTRDKLWGVRRGEPGTKKSAFNEEDIPDVIKANARKRYH